MNSPKSDESKKSAADSVKQFCSYISSNKLFDKEKALSVFLTKSVKLCRQKFSWVPSSPHTLLTLKSVDEDWTDNILNNIYDLFDEEVLKAKEQSVHLQEHIKELERILQTFRQRLEYRQDCTDNLHIVYDDCQNIVTFLKLTTSILTLHANIPLDEEAPDDVYYSYPEYSLDRDDCLVKLALIEAQFLQA